MNIAINKIYKFSFELNIRDIFNLYYFLNYRKNIKYLIINFLREINIVILELRNIFRVI